MTINEIIDYVTHSPENTNPNVLRSMLGNQVSGGQELPEGALVYLPVELDETTEALNKTWNEINQGLYYMRDNGEIYILTAIISQDDHYVIAQTTGRNNTFIADTPDGYPVIYVSPVSPGQDPLFPDPSGQTIV